METEERVLDDWIATFLEMTAFNTEPPMLYKIWTAISVIAAALQRKCVLPWEKLIYPNMYIVLVGPPGHRKGTAMYPAEELIRQVGFIHLASEATTRENLIRELRNSLRMDTDAATGNVTQHCSLTVHSAELAVFLGYKNTVLMSDLCDWYDCRDRWRYRTKTQGEDDIPGVFVNLLGATTPELLQNTMSVDAIGSGLPSRIIFVYSNAGGLPCPHAFITEKELNLQRLLIHDLEKIYLMSGEFRPNGDYLDAYTEWYMKQATGPPVISDDRFSGYCQRRATHLRKLSMIMSASKSNSRILTGEDFTNALNLLIKTEKKMPLTFVGVGKNNQADAVNKAVMYIGGAGQISTQELLRLMCRDVDSKTFDSILSTLRRMGVIRITSDNKGTEIIHYITPTKSRGTFDLQLTVDKNET